MRRSTKIVVTIGPSSDTRDTIARMLAAGMDVARLNFSHGTHAHHAEVITMLRETAAQTGRPLTIVQDLQGPKIRTGTLLHGQPVQLTPGARFTITTRETSGTSERVSTTYEALPRDLHPRDHVLLSDGLIELVVRCTTDDEIETEVVVGGELREHQGINLPGVHVSAPSLTAKDALDLEFGLSQNVDYVALSFVRRSRDLVELKARIAATGKNVPVIAKIEKQEALDDIAAILKLADAIMVARGDLGVEMPLEQVPLVQKVLIEEANAVGIPVITATQMLDSMIRHPRPTRAEASDVANAIIDGTDAVMLSGETAVGLFPVEAIATMARIAAVTEASGRHGDYGAPPLLNIEFPKDVANAVSAAAYALVEALSVTAIVALTQSGNTAQLIARHRPRAPILAFTPSDLTYRRLNLIWGVTPLMSSHETHLSDLSLQINATLCERKLAKPGDLIVMLGGHPLVERGKTNFLKVVEITG